MLCSIQILKIFTIFLQKLTKQIVMTDDESEGETATTAATNGGDDGGDSSAKRRLRNRRLNLNKLSREDVLNGVFDC